MILLSKSKMMWRKFLRGFRRAGPMAVKAARVRVRAAGPVALIERRRGAIGQCAPTREQPLRKDLPFLVHHVVYGTREPTYPAAFNWPRA